MKEIIPAKALDQHIAILGKTGSGKTFAAKGVVEGLVDSGRQIAVLDPTSAWWGLRLSKDGKSKGFDVVLIGGDHGDIPLAPRSGEAVARLVTEQHASIVVDTSGLTMGEQTRWFIDFAGTLYSTIRNPLNLVIDEAHNFAPQGKVPDPDTGKMLHAANRLMSGGRSRGIRAMLITQRPAKLHKDSLSCADTLIAMRVMAPQDRKAIKEWIDGAGDDEQGKRVLDSLAMLSKGEGWVWYPEGGHLERVKFPAIATYDSSATPTGDGRKPVAVGEIDLSAVKSAMADAMKEAEANDPKALRRRIAELEKRVGQPTADHAAIERACAARDEHWRRVVSTQEDRSEQAIKALVQIEAARNSISNHLKIVLQCIQTNASELHAAEVVGTKQTNLTERGAKHVGAQPPAKDHGLTRVAAATVEAPQRSTGSAAPRPSREVWTSPAAGNAGGNIGGGLRRMMIALAQRPQGLNRKQLGARAGLSSKSGTFDTYLSRARQASWIRNAGDKMILTDGGLRELGEYEPLPIGEDLIAYWLGKVGGGAARILRALCDRYPESLTREQLGIAANLSHTSGTFDTYLSRLRTLELIEGRGEIKASEELFE